MKYNEIFTFDNLLNAHFTARKSKRHKKDVVLFEINLSQNLWDLHKRLNNKTYQIGGYNKFNIYEPKKREIQALSYYDRIMQHTLCDNYLYELITSKLIYDNAACQKGKGTDFSRKRLSRFLSEYYKKFGRKGYILKADVRRYFPSIDHDILKSKLSKIVDDADILNLLYIIIDSYNFEENIGIPMGNQTSQLFALYYLDEIDRLCKEKLRFKYYVRYMDDIVIIHPSKEFLQNSLNIMNYILENKLELEFNNKTQIFPIKNGVDFLGFHFYLTENGKVIKKLRSSSKKRYKKKMKKLQYDYSNWNKDLEEVKQSLAGHNGHLKSGNTYQLKKSFIFHLLG